MSVDVLERPPDTTDASLHEDITHLCCPLCDPPIALCGADVSGGDWTIVDDEEDICPACDDVYERNDVCGFCGKVYP